MKHFDILILGGGHAGLEAAYIASQFNLTVGIITMPGIPLGSAPCNPSVGGVGKGQVVRELDALGGLMGVLADKSGIQFRTLNDSKGFAVQSTRVQIDKEAYALSAEEIISQIPNITVIREKVTTVKKEDEGFAVNSDNRSYRTKKLVVTVGTFLNGKLHTGSIQTEGGRHECDKSPGMEDLFADIKTNVMRFKTGTPPRIHKDSIDYSALEEQSSDGTVRNFHCMNKPFKRALEQRSCYLAHTNDETMNLIRENKEKSPMFNGQIKGVGARYCPSIEDKAYRYPDKNIHHVFVEPEGLNLTTMYPSGISSSLPKEIQEKYLRSIKGLENAEIEVYGYAVEYDVLDTTELDITLQYKKMPGLYFAGQVNGTSGYEEAAGQGYIAGCNAALSSLNREKLVLNRHDSYIGLMIEDLTSNLRDEPYRLFTARSENRLYIREDNSIHRMYPYRKQLNLQTELDEYLNSFISSYETLSSSLDDIIIEENFLKNSDVERKMTLSELLKQAKVNPVTALGEYFEKIGLNISYDLVRAVAIGKKYEGYIKRTEQQNTQIKKMDSMAIEWSQICSSKNISFECKQRIERIKPSTFGQLKLIEGIRPATLAVVAARAL